MGVAALARASVAGLLATGAALAVGELVAVGVSRFSSPYYAVGALLVDNAPSSVREFAITTFGTSDKMVLLTGMAVGIAVLGVVAGLIERRSKPFGSALIVLFGIVGSAAALQRPTSDAIYVVPSLMSIVAGIVVLRWLSGYFSKTNRADPTIGGLSRRAFVTAAAGTAAVATGSAVVGKQLSRLGDAVSERKKLRLPAPVDAAQPVPSGVNISLPGATSFVTDTKDFYRIDTALQVPNLTTSDWQLRIHGMCDTPITLDWGDLMGMKPIERIISMTCVSNQVGGDLAGTATWLGYPIKDILAKVGVHDDADMLLATSVDGFTMGSPVKTITDGRDALLVIGMNGEPLPLEHGYPVRQVIPGLYGFVSACKWVVDWELTRFDRVQAYWTQRGWGERGPIKTASRIDRPASFSNLPAGEVLVAGTAWAQHRGIAKVEVRADNGPWEQAELAEQYDVDTWRQWLYRWNATPGQHTLYCRATDQAGALQIEERTPPIPGGATGWQSRVLTIT